MSVAFFGTGPWRTRLEDAQQDVDEGIGDDIIAGHKPQEYYIEKSYDHGTAFYRAHVGRQLVKYEKIAYPD